MGNSNLDKMNIGPTPFNVIAKGVITRVGADFVYVGVRSLNREREYGPVQWSFSASPTKGDSVLVGFDDTGAAWVVGWRGAELPGFTLPIAESDVTGLLDDLASKVGKAGAETVTGPKTFTATQTFSPGAIAPAMRVVPFTKGRFIDFRGGVDGVSITDHDPPQPDYIDGVVITTAASASMRYYLASLLAPLPAWLRITSTAASTAYIRLLPITLPKLLDHNWRFYLHNEGTPAVNIRLAEWQKGGATSLVRLRMSTARKLEILDGSNASKGLSTTALTNGADYRVSVRIVQGTAGYVVVKIYSAHSTAPLETLTSSVFDTGSYCDTFLLGNVNNANLAGVFFRIGAIAGACDVEPGPYTGDDSAAFRVGEDEGYAAVEFPADGGMRVRNTQEFEHDLGDHFRILEGTIVAQIAPNGSIAVGPSNSMGNPLRGGAADNRLPRTLIDAETGRITSISYDAVQLNDPPDFSFQRVAAIDLVYGTGAKTIAGNPAVSFTDLELFRPMVGLPITIDGVLYKITKLLSASSCEVDPTPAASGDPLAWHTRPYPYPQIIAGCGTVSAGEIRWSPAANKLIRKATTGCTTVAGSNSVTIVGANFTDADEGRWLLINRDVTLAAQGAFQIMNVVDATHATLDFPVPEALANVRWSIAGGLSDPGVLHTGYDPISIAVRTTTPTCIFGDSPGDILSSGDIYFIGRLNKALGDFGSGGDTLFVARDTGDFEVPYGDVLAEGRPLGSRALAFMLG